MHLHPAKDDAGRPVVIENPCSSSSLSAWGMPRSSATAVPGQFMPLGLNGIPFDDWYDAPTDSEGWRNVEGQAAISEPPFLHTKRRSEAAGCFIREPDGRVWVMHPTNGFSGHRTRLPKGRVEDGVGMQATAIREVFEETGLKVRIVKWLVDCIGETSTTRFYLAERVGGNPASAGWEAQAVSLVPISALRRVLTHPCDLKTLAQFWGM